jgi:hypothetical protein
MDKRPKMLFFRARELKGGYTAFDVIRWEYPRTADGKRVGSAKAFILGVLSESYSYLDRLPDDLKAKATEAEVIEAQAFWSAHQSKRQEDATARRLATAPVMLGAAVKDILEASTAHLSSDEIAKAIETMSGAVKALKKAAKSKISAGGKSENQVLESV